MPVWEGTVLTDLKKAKKARIWEDYSTKCFFSLITSFSLSNHLFPSYVSFAR